MFCTKCGSPMGEGEKFCTQCGAPRSEAPTASPAFWKYLRRVESNAGQSAEYVPELGAYQLYSERFSAALSKMKQFFFLKEAEGADAAAAKAFSQACMQRALQIYQGLPRGFQNGVVCYAVLCQEHATPGALEFVRELPGNHFAAFESPMLFEYSTGNLYYCTRLPVWGFGMVGGIRKAGAKVLSV
jgi:hypothetical protein